MVTNSKAIEFLFQTDDEVADCLAYWQDRLRLNDWQVTVELASIRRLPQECYGYCKWDLRLKVAQIMILRQEDYDSSLALLPYDMEQTLVHELLHLHFAPLQPEDDNSKEYIMMEQAVDAIAMGLVEAMRDEVECS